MNDWKLKINGVESSLSELGIERFNLAFKTMGEDALTLSEKPSPLNVAPVLSYGDAVVLVETVGTTDHIRFIGTVVTNPRVGTPAAIERRSYTCQNIFWALNQIIYEQDWHEDAANTYYKGRVVLGKNAEDERVSIDSALADVVGYAQNAGLSFSFSAPGVSVVPPDSEFLDITCFEAIRNLLNWAPAVATSVDYSSGSPVIRFVERAAATPVEFIASELASLSITPRNDLLLNGVVLNYEYLHNNEGSTYTTVSQDIAGTTSGLGVLRQTIDLYGLDSNTTTQEVEVEVANPGDPTSSDFWTTHVPGLASVTDLVITSGQSPIEAAAYPSQLVKGQIMDWMDNGGTQVAAVEAEFTASATFKVNGNQYKDIILSHTMVLTNAATKTYRQTTAASYTAPEDLPEGVAAHIFAARSVLHYEGQLVIRAANPDFSATTSNVCDLAPGGDAQQWDDAEQWDDALQWLDSVGGFAGLDDIKAVIESINISVAVGDAATTTIRVGPPRHLQASDFVAIARASRTRVTSAFSRKEPADSDSGVFTTGGNSAGKNSALLGGGFPANAAEDQAIFFQGGVPVWGDIPTELPQSPSAGDLTYYDETEEKWLSLPIGEAGYHLTAEAGELSWGAPPTELPDGSDGDLLYYYDNSWGVLGVGDEGYLLTVSDYDSLEWAAPSPPVPLGEEGDLLRRGSEGWEAITLADLFNLSGSGVVSFDGTDFYISDAYGLGGYVYTDGAL